MNKRKVLCLILALCALTLTACQQKEVFDTNLPPASQPTAEVTEEPAQESTNAETEDKEEPAEE